MAKWVRLWGKKRGTRMSGWWLVGSVSEAAFFGALFLLGIVTLTIVVSRQVFFPESSLLRPGFGFWLMVIASGSFIVIGLTAFILQVSQTLASPEMRSALAQKAKHEHFRRAEGDHASLANLPSLKSLTDSPGTKLRYRLAVQPGETTPLVVSALFTTAWNSVVAVLFALSVQHFRSGAPNWFLTVLLVPFLTVSFFATRWFFRLLRRQTGIGPTAVEIDALPLLPGEEYQLYLCQYGRTQFAKLGLSLVSFEETTYQQGTDVRTERREVCRIRAEMLWADHPESHAGSAAGNLAPRRSDPERETPEQEMLNKGEVQERGTQQAGQPPSDRSQFDEESDQRKLIADPERPLEMDCKLRLPDDMMHSFQSEHNAVIWKIVVEGDAPKWPAFCRSFPVAVYPRSAV